MAGALCSFFALLLSLVGFFSSAGIGSPQLATVVLVITITGFLVGTSAGIWTAVAVSVLLLALVYGREIGVVPEPLAGDSPYMTWAALTSIIALSAVFVHVFVSAMTDARRDAAEKSSALEEEMQGRERAEASLRRAEKLEALGRLTGGIAHDFNNILTVLLAESQMLEAHAVAGRPLGAEEVEQIAELRRSSERAAALTGQLLSFSRQRVGTPELIDPNVALERLQPLLRRVVREEIRLDVDLLPKVGAVRMDTAQFDQVVMNLILNACDALPGRGEIYGSHRGSRLRRDLAGDSPGCATRPACRARRFGLRGWDRRRAPRPDLRSVLHDQRPGVASGHGPRPRLGARYRYRRGRPHHGRKRSRAWSSLLRVSASRC